MRPCERADRRGFGDDPHTEHELGHRRHSVRPVGDRKIAGVCAGFARYPDVDPVLVRVLWLVLALTAGVGFIAYIVAWIVMPKEESLPPAAFTERASTEG